MFSPKRCTVGNADVVVRVDFDADAALLQVLLHRLCLSLTNAFCSEEIWKKNDEISKKKHFSIVASRVLPQ